MRFMKKTHKHKKGVLLDHKKDGKKLIPPYIAALGQPNFISWYDKIIPEVIWIGLLQQKFGQQEGIALSLDLAQAADKIVPRKGSSFFAAASDYATINAEQKTAILDDLAVSKKLIHFQRALFPLMHFYPSCPLGFLSSQDIMCEPSDALCCLKEVLHGLFDKEHKKTVFVQATVVYLAFVLGRLKVMEGLTLANFPEVEKYPETEMSMRVAAAVRSAVIGFFGVTKGEIQPNWPIEFWSRGMELETCTFNHE
jgi:hypothetical protein